MLSFIVNNIVNDFTKVKTFSKLNPGYHRLSVTSTNLTGSKFTILFKKLSLYDKL